MYHYIRNKNKDFPFYNITEKKKYLNQIEKFSQKGFVSSYAELFSESEKYLLTFDDGFKDHIYAAEILQKYGAIGIFFIPTSPLKNDLILDVHKTHLIIGKVSGLDALNELKKILKKKNIKNYFNPEEKSKYKNAYRNQVDETYKKEFKATMNYYGNLELKHKILDHLLKKFEIHVEAKDYYLNEGEIRYLDSMGMIIGCHSESHTLLSRLSYHEQFKEIMNSKIFLENIINKKVETFCYPYGRKVSYNKNTLQILKKLKFKLAYSVEHRDISPNDISNNPYELPRYDCNLF